MHLAAACQQVHCVACFDGLILESNNNINSNSGI